MAILGMYNFDQFEEGIEFRTSAAATASNAMSKAPQPNLALGLLPQMMFNSSVNPTTLTAARITTRNVAGQNKKLLEFVTTSTAYWQSYLINTTLVPAKYKVAGGVFIFGMRLFLTHSSVATPRFIWYHSGSISFSSTGTGTSATLPSGSSRYVEVHVAYTGPTTCTVTIYSNSTQVATFTSTSGQWSVRIGSHGDTTTGGNPLINSSSGVDGPWTTNTFGVTDFYVAGNLPDDAVKTPLLGPISVKSLELDVPNVLGNWRLSPGANNYSDVLAKKLPNGSATIDTDSYVLTDPSGRSGAFKFKAPNEALPILATQMGLVARQPKDASTNLQYFFPAGGDNTVVTAPLNLEPLSSVLTMNAVNPADGTSFAASDIPSQVLTLNSVKK